MRNSKLPNPESVTTQTYWVTGIILLLLYAVAFYPLTDWVYTHWIFNYEVEFVKRGLIGEFFRITGIFPSFTLILIITTLISAVVTLVLLYVFITPYRFSKEMWSGTWLFFLCAATHSATIQHLLFDTGRFDHILILITIAGMYWVRKLPGMLAALLVLLLSSVALLIHEAYFFLFMTLFFSWWIYVDRGSIGLNITRAVMFVLLTLLTWIIGTYGRISVLEYQDYLPMLQEQFGERIVLASLAVLYRGFDENLEYTMYWLAHLEFFWIHVFFFLLTMIPTIYLIWKIVRDDFMRFKTDKDALFRCLVFICCMAPIALTPFGFDLIRWLCMMFINFFVAFAFLSTESDFRRRLNDVVSTHAPVCWLIIAFSMILGFAGNTYSYRWPNTVIEFLGF